ncbi:putative MYST-like histone acetyltransferase 1 isoform X1 [Papaver somniferum]|nr:putative MYST-like histone acetyltransferase 1 isoform X1 [Papaver somniferum]XP_026447879.1 putative MYST-like histone acetyltransferase 1 isoform X1 [Papaver somniferum]
MFMLFSFFSVKTTIVAYYDVYLHLFCIPSVTAHRRTDEWVQLAQLDIETLMPNVEAVTPEELFRVRTVDFIQLHRNEIKTWYPSPVMSEFKDCIKLHVCECCLAFTNFKTQLKRHKKECQGRDPPGHEIYIDGQLSVFQIDGAENKGYYDNLCHLGSMFLDIGISSETIESSMFYVLVVRDDLGYDLIAYFSEVKEMMEPYGSSRFLCLPPHQRRGYATLLVRLACELKRGEDAGALSYYSKFLKWIHWRAAKPLPGQSYEEFIPFF